MNFFSRFTCTTRARHIALVCLFLLGNIFSHPAKAIVCASGTYCLATTPGQTYINNLGVSVLGIGSIDGIPTNNITLINYGAITAYTSDGMFAQGSNVTILNAGTVNRGNQYFGIYLGGADSRITNTGAITTTDFFGIGARGASVNVVIVNSGTITTTAGGEGIYADQSNASITNSGLIETSGTSAYGVYSASTSTTIDITSAGRIVTGGSSAHGIQIASGSAAITMQGTITLNGPSAYGINNVAGIVTLSNSQGAGNAAGPLTYKGVLPTTYNIIILGAGTYGRLSGSGGVTGTMSFGISSLSAGSSIVSSTVYTSVLSGITNTQLGLTGSVSSLSGVSNSYSYTLSETTTGSGIWNLLISGYSGGSGGDSVSTISAGASVTSSLLASGTVFNGGTLTMLPGGSSSSIVLGSNGATVITPPSGRGTLSGVISGSGGLTISSGTGTGLDGTVFLTGANTYSGGTTISSGTLQISGASALGTGNVFVGPGGMLMGTGTIAGSLNVAGTLKPGNSPGYLQIGGSVTMQSTSTFMQDIAGLVQSSSSTPLGASGYYAYLNSTGGQFVIEAGARLTPRLSGLFSTDEVGYGSASYVPALGDRFRIITAAGGVNGRFSALTQPAGLASGSQLIAFYNINASNSIDLATVPTSYANTLSGETKSTQTVATVLDQLLGTNQNGTASAAQEQLLYAVAGQTATSLPAFTQSLAGEVHAASVSSIPQTTQRVQQSVQMRLGDYTSGPAALAKANTVSATNASVQNGIGWGEIAYQRADRVSNDQASGYTSNLYQAVFGFDTLADPSTGLKLGGGFALSNTNLQARGGASTAQQGALFAYGKMPVLDSYVLDAMLSVGLSSSDLSRSDVTGWSNGFKNKAIIGQDALLSLGLSRAFQYQDMQITPYLRLTYQYVNQAGYNEGGTAAALEIGRFTGNGGRALVGMSVGSLAKDPLKDDYTYRANIAVGADTQALLNPTLNTTLGGYSSSVTTPGAGAAFVQIGLYGTAKVSDNFYAYAGIAAEARTGQTLYGGSVGLRLQF